jgi:hypothetical protein
LFFLYQTDGFIPGKGILSISAYSALIRRFFFMAVLAAICQGTVFAVVFLTSLTISVAGTGISTLTGFIDLLQHIIILTLWEENVNVHSN